MKKSAMIFGVAAVLSVFSLLQAQVAGDSIALVTSGIMEQEQLQTSVDVEIAEILFDETITKIGRDFYDEFYTRWENPTNITSFSITVKERPMPGLGTQVTVLINENELFVRFLQPKQELIELMSQYAVQICQQYLANYQDIQRQLQSEDQMGTGIF